jgi:hypothetical protein
MSMIIRCYLVCENILSVHKRVFFVNIGQISVDCSGACNGH